MILSLISFALGIVCYSISQLHIHGKLNWSKDNYGFWDSLSHYRKYKKNWIIDPRGYDRFKAPNNFYYKYIARVKYRERWFTSTNITVFLTDGYHFAQHLSFVLFSLSLSLTTDINFFWIWGGILFVNFVTYRLLQK